MVAQEVTWWTDTEVRTRESEGKAVGVGGA